MCHKASVLLTTSGLWHMPFPGLRRSSPCALIPAVIKGYVGLFEMASEGLDYEPGLSTRPRNTVSEINMEVLDV